MLWCLNLPLPVLAPDSAMDSSGTLHALAWNSGPSGANVLTYVRGH